MVNDLNLSSFREVNGEWSEGLGANELAELFSVHVAFPGRLDVNNSSYRAAARRAAASPSISARVRFSVTATVIVSIRPGYQRPACSPAK